jgi:hypothetical protein
MRIDDNGDRRGYIACRVARKLQPSILYADPWYRRFIIAHVINQRADQIELFGAQVPGDNQINISVLRNRADKLLDSVMQYEQDETDTEFYINKCRKKLK